MEQKKYHIITYGCQMNVHESEKVAGALSSLGFNYTKDITDSDIIVFNTCCIRENAENHAYGNIGALKSFKKNNKNKIIAVGGCMTQQVGAAEKLIEKFPFVDIVFGTHNLNDFEALLKQHLKSKKKVVEIIDTKGCVSETDTIGRSSFPNAWVNINYGCDNYCSYCIVPYVRGRERSRLPNDILNEVTGLIKEGYKEITLLGQNVNSYGKDLKDIDFPTLLKECAEIEGDFRIRFMSSHPKDLNEQLVRVMSESSKICRSIHLPMQSGSNNILKLMNRRYTREDYISKVELIRKYIPDCEITTDIMVGFPYETEQDFEQTLNIVQTCGFSNAFTFVYSKRSGTKAAEMDGQIDEDIKKSRIIRLVNEVADMSRKRSKLYLGKIVSVLCEGYDKKKGLYMGRDTYNKMVYFESSINLIGQFVEVKITRTGGVSLKGSLISQYNNFVI